jgi:hypothetical protein
VKTKPPSHDQHLSQTVRSWHMGRAARAKKHTIKNQPSTMAKKTISTQVERSGLGGQPQRMVIRPAYVDLSDPRNAIPIGGAPGLYRVVFTLARPGYTPVGERDFNADPDLPGDSHLAILPPAVQAPTDNPGATQVRIRVKADSEELMFDGFPNAGGFLGRLITTLEATDFRNAETRATQALNSSLSNWSAHLDVPFWVWRSHVTEVASEAIEISVTNPFPEVPFALSGTGSLSKEFRPLVSLYREGLSTNSPAYSYLCFFKIAEVILKRRQRMHAEAVARGDKPNRPFERIPDDPRLFIGWLDAVFPVRPAKWDEFTLDSVFPVVSRGRKINELLDKELVDLRNDIGHALSDETGEASLVFDDAQHIARLQNWLPLMRCIARRMLKNEFPSEFLTYVKEDRTEPG